MKNTFLIFLILLISQSIFSQEDNRLAEIGQQTSDLLIQGEHIDDFQYAIKIKSLYPDEDFSQFEDSPAEFILNMLFHAELELPEIWNELLNRANQYKIDKRSNYVSTFFSKIGGDTYVVSSVIESQSKYYMFSYNLLEWDKDIYISRFFKEIKEFENFEDIESDPFSIIENEIQNELNEMDDNFLPESTTIKNE